MNTILVRKSLWLVALLLPAVLAARVPVMDPERGVMTMAPLVEEVTPAVVSISVATRAPAQDNPLLRDPFFRRFFQMPERQPQREAMSAGSGVIVDAKRGFVVTNHHVVDAASRVTVTLKDRRQFSAKLVGSDPETDIALLRIEADDLRELPLANSDLLQVGDIVFAIGNPFGLGQTVTSGIVSALGRGIGMHGYEDFIQTDAPINPGNSGGALVNSKGELVGINTAIIGPAGGNVGIGFAVPMNMARAVIDQLARYGEVRRGRIGVSIQDLTPDLAQALNIAATGGAVVSSVEENSPAAAAGLRAGDVITQADGEPVRDAGDLRNRVGMVERGRSMEIVYIRQGQTRRVRLEVGEQRLSSLDGEKAMPGLAGARFGDLPQDHPAFGNVEGVLVTEVAPGSPAWRAGLRDNDIILGVNQRPVTSLAQFRATVAKLERVVAFNLLRGNTQLFLVLR